MNPESSNRTIQSLPAVLFAWNLFDLVLHVAIGMAKPLRITGNAGAI